MEPKERQYIEENFSAIAYVESVGNVLDVLEAGFINAVGFAETVKIIWKKTGKDDMIEYLGKDKWPDWHAKFKNRFNAQKSAFKKVAPKK